MGSLNAFGGKNILDMTLSKFYQQNASLFKGNGTAAGFSYSFEMTQAPVADLVPGGANPRHNLKIRMGRIAMNIAPSGGGNPRINRNIVLVAFAVFSIANGRLSLSSVQIRIEDPSPIDVAIQNLINSTIGPVFQRALTGIPLPQLHKLFGTSLSAVVRSGDVISGPALQIAANIEDHSNFRNADPPTATNLASLNSGSATNALVMGLASDRAVNGVISEMLKPFSYRFNETATAAFGFTAGIKGTISATVPVLAISNGVGRASTRISTSMTGGVKAPVGPWIWVPFPIPAVDVTVTNSLAVVNGKGVVKLTGLDHINVDLNFPGPLQQVENAINNLLNAVLRHFKGEVDAAVSRNSFDIFEPPATIPGTNFGITLSFPGTGLSYHRSSVQAIIRLRG